MNKKLETTLTPSEPRVKIGAVIFCFLLGLLFFGAFTSMVTDASFGSRLTCQKASQTCYFENFYLYPKKYEVIFNFSDVISIYPVLDRGVKANFSYMIIQLNQGNIQMGRPSDYIARKEIQKLQAYLNDPNMPEMVITENPSLALFFFMSLCFSIGIFFIGLPLFGLYKQRQKDLLRKETEKHV